VSWGIKLNFISQNPFEILRVQSKVKDKFHRGKLEGTFFKTPSLNFVYNFLEGSEKGGYNASYQITTL